MKVVVFLTVVGLALFSQLVLGETVPFWALVLLFWTGIVAWDKW